LSRQLPYPPKRTPNPAAPRRPPPLMNPSQMECCRLCLLRGRIDWYDPAHTYWPLWHRVRRGHWPEPTEGTWEGTTGIDKLYARLANICARCGEPNAASRHRDLRADATQEYDPGEHRFEEPS